MHYKVHCDLDYEVQVAGTPFVFNIEAQRRSGQTVVEEKLRAYPGRPYRQVMMASAKWSSAR